MAANRKDVHDNASIFFEYNVDLANRHIFIGVGQWDCAVDFSMAEKAIKGLSLLEARDTSLPIDITLSTFGGCEYYGLSIFGTIKSCASTTRITGRGPIMSMGVWILQAADERILDPYAKLMIHYGSIYLQDAAINAYRWVEEFKRNDREMEKVLLSRIREKHPRFPLAQLREMLKFDTILTAKQAVALGLADRILGE